MLAALEGAAEGFIRREQGEVRLLASSLDWFQEEWGRDACISLPGLLLVRGRFADARQALTRWARFLKDGLLPIRIPPGPPDARAVLEYNSADAPLWFLQAAQAYFHYTGDAAFLAGLVPRLEDLLGHYRDGTAYVRLGRTCRLGMDGDGLLITPPQATWMDAQPEGRGGPVTPRHGKAVEINALWYAGLRFLARAERGLDRAAQARAWDGLADRCGDAFREKFPAPGTGLYDVIEGDPAGASLRPNMLIAAGLGGDLLEPGTRAAVLVAARELLTPFGLRTLSPRDPMYQGRYHTESPPAEKDLAYHQGTAWPWLMGAYSDALARERTAQGAGRPEIAGEIAALLAPLAEYLLAAPQRSLPEVFDGDAAHRPGGTRSQAWSVAEVLRAYREHALNTSTRR